MSLDSVFKGWRQFLAEEGELTEGSEEWIARAENFIEDNPDPADYPFNDMFDGQFRQVIPLSGDKMALHVGTELRKEDYRIVAKPETQTITRTGLGGVKYQEEVTRNVLFTEKDTVIPKGPKAGETRTTTQKLGRTIRKEFGANSKEYQWWEKNQTFYGEDDNYTALTKLPEYSIIVSRHPIDIMRMSDFSWAGISSCHREGGEYQRCVPGEVAAQGGVAYVVKTEDLEDVGDLQDDEVFADPDRNIDGIAPIARHRLRRFDNDQDTDATGEEGYSILVPDLVTYGKKVRKFYDALRDWSYESQVGKAFEDGARPRLNNFVSRGGTYFDVSSRPGEMFNQFFQPEEDKKYNPNARMPHQREEAETEFRDESEYNELQQAVEENNAWAQGHLDRATAHASIEEIDEDQFYVLYGGSMEIEFDNIPYDPAFKDWRSRSELERAIENADIGDDPYVEEVSVQFYPNRNQKVNEQELEYDPDNPIMGRLDVELRFSTEGYDPSPDGFEEFVRDIGENFDSEYDEVKNEVYLALIEEEAVPERPFDTFKRMIEDDEFPKFENFEVHPEDGKHEIEFRMKKEAVSQNVIGKYNPAWLNNALTRLWDTIDSRMFGYTTQKAIERAMATERELWDFQGSDEALRARGMRIAAIERPTGLEGFAYDADENEIIKLMMRRMKLDRGKSMYNIPLTHVWGGSQDNEYAALKYSEEYSNAVMQRLGEFNQKAKEAAAKQLNLPFADKGEQRKLNFMDKYTHDKGDVVDDLDFNSLGFRALYGQAPVFSPAGRPNKSNVYGAFGLNFDAGMTEEEGEAAIAFMKYVDKNAGEVKRIMSEVMTDGIKQFQMDMINKVRNRWPKVKKEMESVLPEDAIALPFGHMKASIVRDLSAEEQKVSDEVKRGGVGGPIAERIVRNVMKRLGTKSPLIREALFKTLETKKLVKEDDDAYDLLLYAIPVRISISKDLGGDKTQTFNEIRGIEGVTVVRDVEGTAREDDKNYYSTVVIKFELLSGKGPLDYKGKELIPGLKKIKGLAVYNIGDIQQVRM
jgi:hypothetical protein